MVIEIDNDPSVTADGIAETFRFLLHNPAGATPSDRLVPLTVAQARTIFGSGSGSVEDLQPDPFSFTPVTNASLGTIYISNSITVAGINAPVFISVVGGEYSINGGAFTTAQGTVTNGATVRVRRISSTFNEEQVGVSLTIGGPDNGYTAAFLITTGAVWAPDPELVVRDFNHTDLPEGLVQSWTSGGIWAKTATQGNGTTFQPEKLAIGGVKFTKGARQWLQWAPDTRNVLLDRWGVIVVAADLINNPNVGQFNFGYIDGISGGDSYRHPAYLLDATAGVFKAGLQTYRFADDGATPIHVFDSLPIDGDINTKQLIVWARRENKIYVRVNGVQATPSYYGGWRPAEESANYISVLGYTPANGNRADFIIYRIMTGQSELNDVQLDKLEGWAAHVYGIPLPGGHPYEDEPPESIDANDTPRHYEFDAVDWATFQAAVGSATDLGTDKYAHRGEAEVAQTGFETVFFEDFKTDPLVRNYLGPKGSSLYCPLNPPTTVLHNAAAPVKNTTNYRFDHSGDGTLTLRLEDASGQWRSAAFQSVNVNGVGRAWGGRRLLEIKAKFPLLSPPRPGFFPAFWGYNEESYFFQTRPRLEWDNFEYDGINGAYHNQTIHLHEGNIPYPAEEFVPPSTRQKTIAYELIEANGIDPPVDIYDGEFHVWKYWIESDFTYASVDGLEICRIPTIPELLERYVLLVDWAYRSAENVATPGQTYDFTIDYVKVMRKATELAEFPAAFSARPTLAGTPTVPNQFTLNPRITSDQLQVHWYRDGVPVVNRTDSLTYVLAAGDVGHKIRASVRAMDLIDQPEAWTAESATIS